MSQSDPSDDNGSVGYGRPPVGRQFKPGQSGNPKGRRKGQKNFATMFAEALKDRVRVRDKSGKIRSLTKKQAMIEVLINQGLAGNLKAVDKLLQLADKYAASEPQSYWDPVEAEKAREKLMRIIEVKAEERAKAHGSPLKRAQGRTARRLGLQARNQDLATRSQTRECSRRVRVGRGARAKKTTKRQKRR